MQIHKVLFSLTLAFLVAANCVAQDGAKKADDPKAKKAQARQIANTTKQMMKAFEAVNLTDEQKEKAKAIVTKHVASLTAARKAQEALLSDEQKAKQKAAVAKAKEDGVKGNKVWAAGVAAMELSKEEAEKFEAAKKKVAEVNAKMKEAITALLTDEQKAAMPKAKGKKGKGAGKNKKKASDDGDDGLTQTVSLKLPGMT